MTKKKRVIVEDGEERAAGPSQTHRLHLGLSALRLCLDFANTLAGRMTSHPQESFRSYSTLVSWGQRSGMLTPDAASRLALEATDRLAEATATLDRATALREAIYRIFSAVAGGRTPEAADLDLLNGVLSEALAALRVTPTTGGFIWAWGSQRPELGHVLWPIAQSAADLLTSIELRAVRECAAPDCGWLFLDTSRNHSRRWCDMKACGNRAKARRYYERSKQSCEDTAAGWTPARRHRA
jgi:predicted RNA-binding Zn ribbon-like protein